MRFFNMRLRKNCASVLRVCRPLTGISDLYWRCGYFVESPNYNNSIRNYPPVSFNLVFWQILLLLAYCCILDCCILGAGFFLQGENGGIGNF